MVLYIWTDGIKGTESCESIPGCQGQLCFGNSTQELSRFSGSSTVNISLQNSGADSGD